ncbi:MAG: transketolase [Planctomycetota bacterium]|nr:transketolase [Planctomycetota bacterium]
MTVVTDQLQLAANTIRCLSIDAVQKANSGHPGMPMGMADAAVVLWTEFLRWNSKDPHWDGRDRFVLSAGHGSMLLYSLLHLSGFDLSIEDLKQFRQLHSKTPGHPEVGDVPGAETTTGPLGAGFSNGVGMAIAAKMEAAWFDNPLLHSRVFGIVSDGDLMEGISQESASLAGHLALDNLVYLYDDNHITIDGHTDIAFSEDVCARFEALGWHTQAIDGHDFSEVRDALEQACASDKPSLIRCHTTIGKGSPNKSDTPGAHGSPLGAEEVKLTKQALGMPEEAFFVDPRARELFAAAAATNERAYLGWNAEMEGYRAKSPEQFQAWQAFRARTVPDDLYQQLIKATNHQDKAATRALSGQVIQRAAELVPSLVGGSADLNASTKTDIKASGGFQAGERNARNLHFGIREHAMGGILNGLALHGGFLPMGSTFLVFSDYMRPAIRLAALMRQPVTFVFTHDSLMVGEDGPTHQPVEHAAALRLIPNVHLFRPADGMETAAAWAHALSRRDGPVIMLLTRQGLPALQRTGGFDEDQVMRGGYVLRDHPAAKASVIATGSEVSLAMETALLLSKSGLELRVVSMPCVELFTQQPEEYRQQTLGVRPLFALEMGRPEIWCQFTGRLDRVIGQSEFGASAPAQDLATHFGFTPEKVAERIQAAL